MPDESKGRAVMESMLKCEISDEEARRSFPDDSKDDDGWSGG